jgi:hypothetical protein
LLAGAAIAVAFVISRLPPPVAGVGTLDECLGGWPIVAFEGDEWKAALPEDASRYRGGLIPVAEWPSGMRFDEATDTLLDATGAAVFRQGDRVRVNGTIVETRGDPAPCYYLRGLKIDAIAPA